jgi:voltage-gated potassium channel
MKSFIQYIYYIRERATKHWIVSSLFFLSLLAYSTTGFMYFELSKQPDLKWIDAIWWSIVTMTTVGYGDLNVMTLNGRVFIGFPTMLLGVSILGYLLSYVASTILESKLKEIKGMKTLNFSKHIIISRFNSLGKFLTLVQEIKKDISTKNLKIVLIDNSLDELPGELQEMGIFFVKGDPSRESILLKANFESASSIIIPADDNDLINSDHKNLAVALTIERLCPEIYTVVECVNPENEVFLQRADVDSIISMSSLTNQMMIQELQDPGIHTIISELTSNRYGKQLYIVDVDKEIFEKFGKIKKHYESLGNVVLGIRRRDENFLGPKDKFKLLKNDKVIIIGSERP